MPNINVKKRLENILGDLDEVIEYMRDYHGVPEKDIRFVDNAGTHIAEAGELLSEMAAEELRRSRSRG